MHPFKRSKNPSQVNLFGEKQHHKMIGLSKKFETPSFKFCFLCFSLFVFLLEPPLDLPPLDPAKTRAAIESWRLLRIRLHLYRGSLGNRHVSLSGICYTRLNTRHRNLTLWILMFFCLPKQSLSLPHQLELDRGSREDTQNHRAALVFASIKITCEAFASRGQQNRNPTPSLKTT